MTEVFGVDIPLWLFYCLLGVVVWGFCGLFFLYITPPRKRDPLDLSMWDQIRLAWLKFREKVGGWDES